MAALTIEWSYYVQLLIKRLFLKQNISDDTKETNKKQMDMSLLVEQVEIYWYMPLWSCIALNKQTWPRS
jgi:hypothetical protein